MAPEAPPEGGTARADVDEEEDATAGGGRRNQCLGDSGNEPTPGAAYIMPASSPCSFENIS